ncbi:NYN domain-containing protein [Paradesulfitobacterium aromaticivorans]
MKTIAFVDYENIWTGMQERGYKLAPELLVQALQQYAQRTGKDLLAIYLFANFDREEFWRTQTTFEKTNVFTRHVYGKNNYSNTDLRRNAADLELMLEALEILLTRPSTVDVFVLLSGDGDFLPLIRKIRAWGKEVRVIGVDGSVHHSLQPYCESTGIVTEMLSFGSDEEYHPEADMEQALGTLAQIQMRLPYVASTKARTALSERLARPVTQVKELIRYALREKILIEREHSDPSLRIGRTKIYLLNIEHPVVQANLGPLIEEIRERYARLEQ